MRKLFTKIFSPKSYLGDLCLCLFLALLVYITGFLLIFLSEINSGVAGAGIFTVYYVVLLPIFLIPSALLLFVILVIHRYLKNKKNDFS